MLLYLLVRWQVYFHDIGNPPFGHFAEQTINSWIQKEGIKILDSLYEICEENQELKKLLIEDITNFDGNAQAIRIVSKLQRLNPLFFTSWSYTKIH